jgi:hypothetical protein
MSTRGADLPAVVRVPPREYNAFLAAGLLFASAPSKIDLESKPACDPGRQRFSAKFGLA